MTPEQEKAWRKFCISLEEGKDVPMQHEMIWDILCPAILVIDKERTSLRAEVEEAKDRAESFLSMVATGDVEIKKLREAVEWVRPLLTTDDQRKELRRRAGKEG